jgi:PAS domain-containing protein
MDLDGNPLYRTILNAIPSPVFIVDDDVRIADLNGIASTMSGQEKETVLKRRGGETLALVIIEDITEMSKLKDIIPMCMQCRKIRNDQEYWQTVEQYFHDHIGVDFSHGICPACVEKYYAEYRS